MSTSTTSTASDVVVLHRRSIDRVLIALGLLTALVLVVAGALLTWGSSFASDYVGDELRSQNISFPAEDALKGEIAEEKDAALAATLTELLPYAGKQVVDGDQAEAYSKYINVHVLGTSGGKSYAELGGPQRAAAAAAAEAKAANKPAAEVAELEATAAKLSQQRDTVFKGETLRGLLLSTYAWSTIGNIAGIAAIVAFIAAVLMLILVVLGVVHLRRHAAA